MPSSATSPPRVTRRYLLGLSHTDWSVLTRLARHHQTTKADVLRRSLRELAKRSPLPRAS